MPSPSDPAVLSRTVRISADLMDRAEAYRVAAERRGGASVTLRAAVEALLRAGLDTVEGSEASAA